MFKNLRLLDNLKIWQKLALMGVVFAIPMLIPTRGMYSSMGESIVFAEKEVVGASYQLPVQNLIRTLQLYRLTSAALLSGDESFRPKVEEAAKRIVGDLKAVDEIDQQHGESLGVSAQWKAQKDKINAMLGAPKTYAEGAYLAQSKVIGELVAFVAQVGTAANLVSDPEADTANLAYATTVDIPESAELLSRLAALGIGPAVRGNITPDERDDLLKQFAMVSYYTTRLKTGYDQVFTAAPALRQTLGPARQATEDTSKGFLDQLENEFILTREDIVSTSASAWFDTANRSVDAAYILQDKSVAALNELLQARSSSKSGELYSNLALVLFGMLGVAALSFFIIRDITVPLGNAVRAAQMISTGDLSANVATVSRKDEVGQLTNAFGDMIRTLRGQIQSLSSGIQSLSSTTGDIIQALTQVVAGATEAAAAVGEAAITAEEVKQTARVASERSQEVAGSAQQAVRIALDGERSVDDAVQGMTKVREQMESIAESVLKLGERSRAIGEIIAAVNDLAEQSNLLAVNASIEAAKAGEQGRGFAVVAQEVKSLATQSKQATVQVRQMLNDIQKAAGVAVMVTEQGTKSAEAGVKQSIVAGESIRSLAKNIADAAQSVTQITFSSHQQLVGMDRVAGAMDNIRETTSQNVDSMRQIEGAVQSLSEVCANLEELAGRYTLQNGRSVTAA